MFWKHKPNREETVHKPQRTPETSNAIRTETLATSSFIWGKKAIVKGTFSEEDIS